MYLHLKMVKIVMCILPQWKNFLNNEKVKYFWKIKKKERKQKEKKGCFWLYMKKGFEGLGWKPGQRPLRHLAEQVVAWPAWEGWRQRGEGMWVWVRGGIHQTICAACRGQWGETKVVSNFLAFGLYPWTDEVPEASRGHGKTIGFEWKLMSFVLYMLIWKCL